MRSFLAALLLLLFVCCHTISLQGFQIGCRQTENGAAGSGVTFSLFRANDSVILKVATANKEAYVSFAHVARSSHKTAVVTTDKKACSAPAELTLEYIAIQLPRTHLHP